jgi:cyclic-di-GMP-binding biofilm dispersal mediator protein
MGLTSETSIERDKMSELTGRNILVVGGSGALGAEFARQLTAQGASVIATSSSSESASRIPGEAASKFVLNLEDQRSIDDLVNQLTNSGVTIDGVVLAAGEVAFGSAAETPSAITERLMKVNFLGQVAVVSSVVPMLEKSASANREPFVVSISGVIAETPMAGLSSYSASKTALHGYATAATRELRRAGIRWIDARPGHTETGLAGRAIFGVAPAFGQGHTAEKVVARIVEAISNDEKDLPSGSFTA